MSFVRSVVFHIQITSPSHRNRLYRRNTSRLSLPSLVMYRLIMIRIGQVILRSCSNAEHIYLLYSTTALLFDKRCSESDCALVPAIAHWSTSPLGLRPFLRSAVDHRYSCSEHVETSMGRHKVSTNNWYISGHYKTFIGLLGQYHRNGQDRCRVRVGLRYTCHSAENMNTCTAQCTTSMHVDDTTNLVNEIRGCCVTSRYRLIEQ
jgi:hypothetical protein